MNPRHVVALIGGILVSLVVVAAVIAGGPPPVDPDEATLPPEKQEVQDKIDSAQASGRLDPAPKGLANPNPTDQAEEIIPDGGVQAGAGMLFLGDAVAAPPTDKDDQFTSSWSLFGTSQNIDVWAGSRGQDPKQGFVTVVVWDSSRLRIVGGGSYDAPEPHGTLTISGATDLVLELVSGDGTTLRFDAASESFLDGP